jgi:hypothetical protein
MHDNDGKFPDESPVEIRYPRSKQEEQGDREQGAGVRFGDRPPEVSGRVRRSSSRHR